MGKNKKNKEVVKAPPTPESVDPIRTPPIKKQKTKTPSPPKSRSNSKADLRKSLKKLNETAKRSQGGAMDYEFGGPAYPLIENTSSYVFEETKERLPRFSSKDFQFDRGSAASSDAVSSGYKDATKQPKIREILIPGGKAAKLIQIPDPDYEGLRMSEIADKLKFNDPTPVIVLLGAMTTRAGKTLAGAVRAAKRLDAVIVDSGIATGVEKFAMREGINLVGVSPQSEVQFPKLNATSHPMNELTNGHTHFFLIGDDRRAMRWEQEANVKLQLAARIAKGRSKYPSARPCKVVGLFLGDNPQCQEELSLFAKYNWPLLVVPGSSVASTFFQEVTGRDPGQNAESQEERKQSYGSESPTLRSALKSVKRVQVCFNNSEEVASTLHLMLTLTF